MKCREVMQLQAGLMAIPKATLPFKIRWIVGKVINQCRSALGAVDSKQKALYREMGEPNADKTQVAVPPEKWEEFQAKVEAMLDDECVVEFHKIKLADLEAADLDAVHLGALERITEE